MFSKLRLSGRNGDKTKNQSGSGPVRAAPERQADTPNTDPPQTDPPRLDLPRHRPSLLKSAHLKSVAVSRGPDASIPGPSIPGPSAGRESAPVDSRSVAYPKPQPDPRPVSQPVAQPVAQSAQPIGPARPAIPAYPAPGARGATAGAISGTPGSGAEVQSFGRLMLVGPRIRLNGEIKACERLVIEGVVEGEVSETERLEVGRGGHFHGAAQVDSCMVDGMFEGELEVRGILTLKANGRIEGTVRYGEIEIERGGVIAGNFGARAAAETRPARARKAGGPRPA